MRHERLRECLPLFARVNDGNHTRN
jgi:hypothetical protein